MPPPRQTSTRKKRQRISGSHVTTISIKANETKLFIMLCTLCRKPFCLVLWKSAGDPIVCVASKNLPFLNGIPSRLSLKIYYYFKNNIVQSITCLVCVSKRLEIENSPTKKQLPWKKNNINNTIITYLLSSPVFYALHFISLHSPVRVEPVCTHLFSWNRLHRKKKRAATSETFFPHLKFIAPL